MKLPSIPKPNMGVAVSVATGVALFGVLLYLIRRAPANSITNPIKKVAEVANTR